MWHPQTGTYAACYFLVQNPFTLLLQEVLLHRNWHHTEDALVQALPARERIHQPELTEPSDFLQARHRPAQCRTFRSSCSRWPPSYLPRAATPHPQLSTLHMDPGSASVTLFPEVYGLEGVVESKWGFLFASLSGIQCSYETCVWSPSSDACGHTLHCSNSTATLHLV